MTSTVWPGAYDVFTDPTPTTLETQHAELHDEENDAIAALQQDIGKVGETNPNSIRFKLASNGVVNVLDFGTGVGMGSQVTDDLAIAAAFVACPRGGAVYFAPPPIQYTTNGNIPVPPLTRVYANNWRGNGGSTTPLIKLANGSGAKCVFGSQSYLGVSSGPGSDYGITIDHLSIDVNGANNATAHGIVLCPLRAVVEKNLINNPGQSGIVISDENSQGNTSGSMIDQENRVYDNTVQWPANNPATAGQHGIWVTHTTGAHDNSDSFYVHNIVSWSGDNPFQFDSAGDIVVDSNHPWAIVGNDAFFFGNVNRARVVNNIVDNYGFPSTSGQTYCGFHFSSLQGTDALTDNHSATQLTGNQVHANENNLAGVGAFNKTATTTNGTSTLTFTALGSLAVGQSVDGAGTGPISAITGITGSGPFVVTVSDVTGTLTASPYTFTPAGQGTFVGVKVDSVSGTGTTGVLQLTSNTWKQDQAGQGTSTAYEFNAGSNELIVMEANDDVRGPTISSTPVLTGSVSFQPAAGGGTLPVTDITPSVSAPYQALANDCVIVCEGTTAGTVVMPLSPALEQLVSVTNPGTGLIQISPSPGTHLPGVVFRTDTGCSLSGSSLTDSSLTSADVGAFAVNAGIPIGTTILSVVAGVATLSNPVTTASGQSVQICQPLQIYNNQAIQLIWDNAHNSWRFLGRAIASLGGSGLAVVGSQLNTLTSAGAVSNILDDGAGNMRAKGYQSSGATPTVAVAGGGAAGAGATVSVAGNDVGGVITITTGTSPTAGTMAALTYAVALPSPPNVVTPSAQNGVAGGVGLAIVPTPGTNGFSVQFHTAPAASTTYLVGYQVMG